MTEWPRHICGVRDHAVVRFLHRVSMPGYDPTSVIAWIARHRDAHDDTAILGLLRQNDVAVDYFRDVIHGDADASKRRAIAKPDGTFLIAGRHAPYVVSRRGYVITTKNRNHVTDRLLPLFGRWRELETA